MTEVAQISVCICTRNRPEDLRTAIKSVRSSSYSAYEIIVSDDSTDTRSRNLVQAEFPDVVFVEGPRRGLGANRNNAIAVARGTHVTFIDDDVVMAPGFLAGIAEMVAHSGENVIVAGTEIAHGIRVFPHKVSFLGYQSIDYKPDEEHETVVINAAVFPISLFDKVKFDPSLIYGCDEMDFTVRAVEMHGYRIVFVDNLSNNHYPSPVNRDFYSLYGEASRIYVTFKRYYWVERNPVKSMLFLAVAYPHILLYYLRVGGLKGFSLFWKTACRSVCYIVNCLRNRGAYV